MPKTNEMALVETLEKITAELPEEITLDDLRHNEWLRRLVLICDRIENAVTYEALDWAKTR